MSIPMSIRLRDKSKVVTGMIFCIGMITIPASAQVETGWKEVFPPRAVEIETHDKYHLYPYTTSTIAEAGAAYSRTNGVETFTLFNHDTSNRAEVLVQEKWITGVHQLDGEIRVSPPTDNESCMQVFGREKVNGDGGPVAMVSHYSANGGTLWLACGDNSPTLATNIDSQWVKLNVIHDDIANTITVYVNGIKNGPFAAPNGERHKTGASYFKYGCYGSLKTKSASVEWRHLRFFEKPS